METKHKTEDEQTKKENIKEKRRARNLYQKMMALLATKQGQTIFFSFLLGVFAALLPLLLYFHSLQDSLPYWKLVPNSVGYPKDVAVQIVTSRQDIDKVRKSKMHGAHSVDIGAAVKMGERGLNLIPSAEIRLPISHLKFIGLQKKQAKNMNGFSFEPDTLWKRDAMSLYLITTPAELAMVKKMKRFRNRELLEIGAAVACPTMYCAVLGKNTLRTEYSQVVPLLDHKKYKKRTS